MPLVCRRIESRPLDLAFRSGHYRTMYISPQRDGHPISGPYQRLEPGRYEVAFEIKLCEPDTENLENRKCAVLDVVSDFGRITHARREVLVGELAGGARSFKLAFDVYAPAHFEYRVQALAEAAFELGEQPQPVRVGDAAAHGCATGFPDLANGPVPSPIAENPAGFRSIYERGATLEVLGSSICATFNGQSVAIPNGDLSHVTSTFWPHGNRIDVSYAEAEEDVVLLTALRDVSRDDGFYIDVGANDPDISSVTKLFYERGWRGINVEPSPKWSARLAEARPRDVNIQAAVSDVAGNITFFDDIESGLGTIERRFADRHREQGYATQEITVRSMALTEICERYVSGDIHFLKIDVEGHEAAVIRSMDFSRFRPWLLCIEAGEPMNVTARTYHEWDRLVAKAGYLLARSDYLNRYYVAREHIDRLRFFDEPPRGYVRG